MITCQDESGSAKWASREDGMSDRLNTQSLGDVTQEKWQGEKEKNKSPLDKIVFLAGCIKMSLHPSG